MWSIIQAAGWPIWPLIIASVVALALIFERSWSLRQSAIAPPGMGVQFQAIRSEDLERIREFVSVREPIAFVA